MRHLTAVCAIAGMVTVGAVVLSQQEVESAQEDLQASEAEKTLIEKNRLYAKAIKELMSRHPDFNPDFQGNRSAFVISVLREQRVLTDQGTDRLVALRKAMAITTTAEASRERQERDRQEQERQTEYRWQAEIQRARAVGNR